jgi:hypothetical protein
MLKPFKYGFPICFSLPEDCFDRVGCIVPFLFGIQDSYLNYARILSENEVEDTIYIGTKDI